MSKTEVYSTLAEKTGLSKKEISSVLDELSNLVQSHIGKGSVGTFVLPGLLKIKTVNKPARPGVARPVRSRPTMVAGLTFRSEDRLFWLISRERDS